MLVAVGEEAPGARVAALASAGATVLQCKSREGRVDVTDLCARLLGLDVMAVLLEGGGELTGAFLQAGLVDRVAVFVAPKLLGGATAPGPAGGPGLLLPDALRLGRAHRAPARRRLAAGGRRSSADMFTGLVEEVGTVVERAGPRLVVAASQCWRTPASAPAWR